MAVVKPFQALRPVRSAAQEIAALPYDVYSRQEAAEFVKGKPRSFLNIDRPETAFPPEQDMYADEVYEKAAVMLRDEIAAGYFEREAKPCYYVYELTMGGRTQTGIAAVSAVDDYLSGVCRKHENTVAEKEADRIRHVDTLSAQTGPIFLSYHYDAEIGSITSEVKKEEPFCDFVSEDGIRHRIFIIDSDERIARLEAAFAGISHTYIADGHHRAASAVKVALRRRAAKPDYDGTEEFNYFLSVLFPDSELKILDYNRVVHDLNGMTSAEFLEKLISVYDIELLDGCVAECMRPQKKYDTGMYLNGHYYMLHVRSAIKAEIAGDPVRSLDVSVLQDMVLSPMLGIGDPRTDKRISFVGGIRGLGVLRKMTEQYAAENKNRNAGGAGNCAVAFAMYPTEMAELFAVADAGLLMPPKSTWFEPKLRSGLLIHEF